MKLDHLLTPDTEINTKYVKDLNVRPAAIKILEVSTSSDFSEIGCSNIFLDLSPQAKAKINCWPSARLLWRNIYSGPLTIFFKNWILWGFFGVELCKFLIYFGYQPLIRFATCKYLLPFSGLPFCFVDGFLAVQTLFILDVEPTVYFCFCLRRQI